MIETFVAQPATVQLGTASVLIWRINDPDADLQIDHGVGAVSGSSATVMPTATTVYTLTATNAAGSTTAQVTVTLGDVSTTAARSTTVTIAPPATGTGTTLVGGTAWTNVTGDLADMPSECGNLSSISAEPTRDVLIAGVARAGLFANVDPATTAWTALGTGAGSAKIEGHLTSVVYDPDHDGTWWASTELNGGGVFKTVDDGVTFTRLGDVADSVAVSVDLTDPSRATLVSGGPAPSTVDLSTDGGATWKDIGSTLPAGAGVAVAPLVLGPTTYLVGMVNGAASGLYRTADSGASWTLVAPGGASGRPCRPRAARSTG